MRRQDLVVAAAFSALGFYLALSAARFPAGIGRLPGPGFFPGLIGAAMMLLAIALFFSRRRGAGNGRDNADGSHTRVLAALALTALYVALWGRLPFALRTAIFVAVFLRSQAQPWRASLQVAAVLTAAVVAAFEYGLRVHLP